MDLNLDLLTNLKDIIDRVDALTADQTTNLRDVQEAVLAGGQGNKGTEGSRLHDGSHEALPHLGHLRVGNLVDHRACGFCGLTGRCTDVDGSVVLDGQFGAGVFLDLVDHLALGANDFTDLVDGDLDRNDARSVGAHLIGGVDCLLHQIEDLQACVAGLCQCATQHLGVDAIELGVQLQSGDELTGTSDLEVHIAEAVFSTEDVGQGHSLLLAIDFTGHEAHCDTCDGGAQRHASLEQRQGRCTHGTHRRGAVGAHGLGDLADCVGELFTRRNHGLESALCEVTVANFAALGRTHAAGFAGRVRREVVLVHVTLRRNGRKVIQLLLHAEHSQGRHAQNLGLTALEESRTVDARKNLNLGAQGANGTQRTAIHTDFFAQGAVTDGLLLQRTECSLEFLFTLGELLGECFEHIGLDLVDCLFAGELAFSEKSLCELIANPLLDCCVLLVGVIQEDREFSGFLGGNLCNLHLSFAQCTNEGLCGLEAVSHDIFGRRNGACLDEVPFVFAAAGLNHHDGDIFRTVFGGHNTTGNNDIEDGALHL